MPQLWNEALLDEPVAAAYAAVLGIIQAAVAAGVSLGPPATVRALPAAAASSVQSVNSVDLLTPETLHALIAARMRTHSIRRRPGSPGRKPSG